MAAAILAMEHFNQRNSSVVPQLSRAEFRTCPYLFDLQTSRFFDTGTVGHLAAQSYWPIAAAEGPPPCAIAGPFDDDPAVDLAVLAEASQVPMVAQRSFNLQVVSVPSGNYSSMVFPTPIALAQVMSLFFNSTGRTNYTSVLYPSSFLGTQLRETIILQLEIDGFSWFSENFLPPQSGRIPGVNSIETSLAELKDRGFRTIFVAMDNPDQELPVIAAAAQQLGMNNGDFFWLWFGNFDFQHLYSDDPNIIAILFGSAWISPLDPFFLTFNDPFQAAMASQGPEFVDRVNAANPIRQGEPGFEEAGPDFFNFSSHLEFGESYMYDAVMSIGIGACLAQQEPNGTLSGAAHVDGIRAAQFIGASGSVSFSNAGEYAGARVPRGALWAVLNFAPSIPISVDSSVRIPYVYYPENQSWVSLDAFLYADGTETPPPLRNMPSQNYLSQGLRILGFCLMALVLASSVLTAIFVFVNRNHRVLRAA